MPVVWLLMANIAYVKSYKVDIQHDKHCGRCLSCV